MLSENQFDPEALRTVLLGFTPQQRLVFALACTERLVPNYAAFANEEGWGDVATLRAALDVAWDAALGSPPPVDVLHDLQARVTAAEPETTEHATILVSAALDAAAATGLVLCMVAHDDAEITVEVATLGRDTVDMYVQVLAGLAPSDPDLEEKIRGHELMKRELRRQSDDVAALRAAGHDASEVRRLAEKLREPRVGSLGLPPQTGAPR